MASSADLFKGKLIMISTLKRCKPKIWTAEHCMIKDIDSFDQKYTVLYFKLLQTKWFTYIGKYDK